MLLNVVPQNPKTPMKGYENQFEDMDKPQKKQCLTGLIDLNELTKKQEQVGSVDREMEGYDDKLVTIVAAFKPAAKDALNKPISITVASVPSLAKS